jgi:PAS domain S-box-containing protein
MSQTPEFTLGDEFARVLTETTMSLVCVLDQHGRILFFNEACERTTGYKREEVVGCDARDYVIPPEEIGAFTEVLAYIWSTRLSSPQVGHWIAKDGERKLIAWSNKLMPTDNDGPAVLVTTGIDLSAKAQRLRDTGAFEGDPEAKLAEVGRLAQEQRALRRVATLVASEASPERVFAAVSEECARVLEVDASAVFRYEGDDTATILGRYSRSEHDVFTLGLRLPATEDSGIGQVLRTGRPARIHDYTDRKGEVAENMRFMGYSSTVSAPIVVAGILWGAVGIASSEPLPAETEGRLGAFCELVSLAVASAQARQDLNASRARLVKAGDEQRRKLERNLHDGAQQRLVSLALTLRLARRQIDQDLEAAHKSLEAAATELDLALAELRELARGLHPAALTEQGLGPALEAVAQRLPIDVSISAPPVRLPENIEATVYYIVSEALTNVTKHAQADRATVSIGLDNGTLRFEITDDGRGGADPAAGSGILGLRDRAEAVGGTLFVISPPGQGTRVTAQIPLSPA